MRLTIGKQILIGCVILVIAFSALCFYQVSQMNVIKESYNGLLNRSAQLVFDVKDVNVELRNQAAQARGYVLTGDAKYTQAYELSCQTMAGKMDGIAKNLITPEGKKLVGELSAALDEYHKVVDQVIVARKTKGADEAVKLLPLAGQKTEIAEKAVDGTVRFLTERMKMRMDDNKKLVDNIELIVTILSIVLFCLALGAAYFMSRRISRPLADVVKAADRIAAGDLTNKTLSYKGNDEIGDLLASFNTMTDNLRGLVAQVAKASEQLAASSQQLTASAEQSAQASGQVAQTVTNVAEGSSSQVSAVVQTGDIVRDMASAINNIASNAGTVYTKSEETAKAAASGGEAVNAATEQMQTINKSVSQTAAIVAKLGESSRQIDEIINVISGLAGQTNLLALNAAIEAARAGEQGRGFAVVAEEVRKLAEQSEEAAKQIGGIVHGIRTETETAVAAMEQGTVEVIRGTEVIAATGDRFKSIVVSVQQLNTYIHDISKAAEQLEASSGTVVDSVKEIKSIATNTAADSQTISAAAEEQSAAMQEIAASSQALSRMAEELQGVVQRFKL